MLIDPGDDRPVAVASGFRPRIHAERDWCYVEVAPDRRREGIGLQALEALRASLPDDARCLRAKVAADSPGAHFAETQGFVSIQRNRTVRVAPSANARESATFDVEITHSGQPVDDAVVDAWIRYYRDGHDWDPPGDLPRALGRELFFAGDENVVVVRRRGSIVGVACVMTESDGPMFVGGAIARDESDAEAIGSALLDRVDEFSDDGGCSVELDDWMWEIERALERRETTVVDTAFVVANPTARSERLSVDPTGAQLSG